MKANTLNFCGHLSPDVPAAGLANYNPPVFPPPSDFYVSVDINGDPLSRYSDNYWDFRAYGTNGFKFGNYELSTNNRELLKQLTFLYLYHMPLFPGEICTVRGYFKVYVKIFKVAEQNGITADMFYRHPELAKTIIDFLTPNQQSTAIFILEALLRVEGVLGWKIADAEFIKQLVKLQIPHVRSQYAYIPPRIWMSLVKSAERIMDDFVRHQEKFTRGWKWIAAAYKYNIENGFKQASPFCAHDVQTDYFCATSSRAPRKVYPGGASAFYEDYGLAETLYSSVGYTPGQYKQVNVLSSYMTLVRNCAFVYILAHSIQRIGEGLSLRADCFQLDDDPTLGKVAFLVGESTKTNPDSDARWVVPISVGKAVEIINHINQLRMASTFRPVKDEVRQNPYLMTQSLEPWANSQGQPNVSSWVMGRFVEDNPLVFNPDELTITPDDYKVAYQLTPQLIDKSWFKVGGIWSFNAHQLRRTLSVNLFASNVPDRVIQWLMKHKTVQQSYYYGRNYTRLRVNASASEAVVVEALRTQVRNLIDVAENSLKEHVFPTGANLVDTKALSLIEEGDHKKLEQLVRKGLVSVRPTLLGFCMTDSCAYGGVESAVHCAGVDGKAPCKDAVFVKKNTARLQALQQSNAAQLKELDETSPRYAKLLHENNAIEVYLHVTA